MNNKLQQFKINFVFIGFAIGFLAVLISLIKWQVVDRNKYLAIADERFQEIAIPAIRGPILASDDSSLAFSEPRYDVFIWKNELIEAEEKKQQTREEFLEKVSDKVKKTPDEINELLELDSTWIKIGTTISVDSKQALQALKQDSRDTRFLKGLRYQYVNLRNYPEGNLASHIVGFIGKNELGKEIGVGGIEQYWDGSLKPIEGLSSEEVDIFGNPISISEIGEIEARPGVAIKTSIDKNLQARLEKHLQDGFITYQAESATGIILDPKTGSVLALANYPNYDPNEYFKVEDGEVFGNKAVTSPYEIGSVAKVFTLSAALDLEKLATDDIILPSGHNGCEVITPGANINSSCSRDDIQCICTYDKKPVNEAISITDAIVTSDNIAFKHIGETLEYDEFHQYLDGFGIGGITGVDLSGESTGLLKDPDDWQYADFAVYSYGHSYQITPIQAIIGINAIANQGKRMQPYLVTEVTESDGTTIVYEPRVVKQVVSEITAERVAALMHKVYLKNLVEPRYQELAKYDISMKSGTALVPYDDRPGYSSEINTTYVGFDNSQQKKFIMLIKLEKPKNGELSFYNARMLWLDIFKDIKDYMGVPEIYQ